MKKPFMMKGYGDEENRTLDPLLARQVLSQLSYTPTSPRTRLAINKLMIFGLSTILSAPRIVRKLSRIRFRYFFISYLTPFPLPSFSYFLLTFSSFP